MPKWLKLASLVQKKCTFYNFNFLVHSLLFCILSQCRRQIRRLSESCLIRVYSVCSKNYDISEPTHVDMTRNFFVLCTNMKVNLYN